jgi:hypothetical protein
MNILSQEFEDISIAIYVSVSDFYQLVAPYFIESPVKKGPQPKLTPPEIITIAILFVLYGSNDFKSFYSMMRANNFFDYPEYSRMLKLIKAQGVFVNLILHTLIQQNKQNSEGKIKIIDSFPLPVVKNKRIFNYKSSKLAARGKSSIGWYFGYKLHLVIDHEGKLLGLKLTSANVSDVNEDVVLSMMKGLSGILLGDGGYQSKALGDKLREMGISLKNPPRKTMKKLMTKLEHMLMKTRQLVETVGGRIKHRMSMVSSLPRSFDGYMWRYMISVLAYVLISQVL